MGYETLAGEFSMFKSTDPSCCLVSSFPATCTATSTKNLEVWHWHRYVNLSGDLGGFKGPWPFKLPIMMLRICGYFLAKIITHAYSNKRSQTSTRVFIDDSYETELSDVFTQSWYPPNASFRQKTP